MNFSFMIKNYISLVVALFVFIQITAQEKIPYENGVILVQQASELGNQEKYGEAVSVLKKIHPSDSLYANSFVTRSYYQIVQGKYNEAIATIDEGLKLDNPNVRLSFFINKGTCYENLESYDLAKENYLKGLEEYPRSYKLRSNLAIINKRLDENEEAFNNLMLTLESSPLFEKTMLQLGNMYRKQNKKAQALLLYNLYLLFAPDKENSFTVLRMANEMVSTSEKPEDKTSLITKDDVLFETLNLIVDSELALKKDYETSNNLNIGFTKQTHAILNQLKEDPLAGESVLWGEKIIPFFNWITENEHFNSLAYTTAYSIENEEYKKIVSKKTEDIKAFLPIAYKKWISIVRTNTKIIDGKETETAYNYVEGIISGEGAVEKEESPTGEWLYYDFFGRVIAKGNFSKGERDGDWEWYHKNGKLKEKGAYIKGQEQGEYKFYHDNGKRSLKFTFNDGELDGAYYSYSIHGGLKEKRTYTNGVMNGRRQHYFKAGESLIEYDYIVKNDNIDGPFKEYYSSGKLYQEVVFNNGVKEGKEKVYHSNGQLYSEATFKNGEYDGPFSTYYTSGEIKSTGSYNNGENSGSRKNYHSNGVLKEEVTYENGKLSGSDLTYDREGNPVSNFIYRNGLIKEYTYYAKDGTVIDSQKKKSGDLDYKGYMADGTLLSKGIYDIKGGKMGPWFFYDKYGNVTDEAQYEENLAQGAYKIFHNNGNLEDLNTYTDDVITGYGASYYAFGQMETQGYYNDEGYKDGLWLTYYPDGILKTENYYHKGELNGAQKYYAPNGKFAGESIYKYDLILSERYYDDEGKLVEEINRFSPENDEVIYHYFNGQIRSQGQHSNGVLHGSYTSYDFYGNLSAEGTYLNNNLEGILKVYYPDGALKFERGYSNGSTQGWYKDYYENGMPEDSYFYEEGVIEGLSEEYNESGIKIGELTYLEGALHGPRMFYGKEKGTLQLIRYYNQDKLEGYSYLDKNGKELPMIPLPNGSGEVTSYYPNGNKARIMTYVKGNLEGEYLAYYENGNLERKHSNVDDEYQGTAYTYFSDGTLSTETEYLYGYKQGSRKTYHPNGNIKEELIYKNDELSGEAHYYDEEGKKTKTERYFNGEVVKSQTY